MLYIYKYRSARDLDRLLFEYQLSILSTQNKRILYVGMHSRSYIYQKVFPFNFIDFDNTYLLKEDNIRFFCNDILEHNLEYDIVILSGILSYGTNIKKFIQILEKNNFKNYIIHDWIKNLDSHIWLNDKSIKLYKLKNTFWYKY